MGIVLFRVDERLIHGQVTVGWGRRLRPERYVVVDDRLPDSEWERELFELGVPEGIAAEFVTVADARKLLSDWKVADLPVVLLTRNLDHMLRLADGGMMTGEVVNLGGIHHGPGRTQVLPYVFLDREDRDRIRSLEKEGVTVQAQDLPNSRRTPVGKLVDD